jgi:hypothetical protein
MRLALGVGMPSSLRTRRPPVGCTRALRVRVLAGIVLAAPAVATAGCGSDEQSEAAAAKASAISSLIRSDHYQALVFEVDAVPSVVPTEWTQAKVVSELAGLVDKPAGISVTIDEALGPRGDDHAWTSEELGALVDQTANMVAPAGTFVVHVVAVDGHAQSDHASSDSATLALAWGDSTVVLFGQTIRRMCAAPPTSLTLQAQLCEQSEALVWLHELGHLMGLVDLGLPMEHAHADPVHAGHDVNPECIMYWLFHRSGQVVQKLRARLVRNETQPPTFDRACLDDIAALRDGF